MICINTLTNKTTNSSGSEETAYVKEDIVLEAKSWNTTDKTYTISKSYIQENSLIILNLKSDYTSKEYDAAVLAKIMDAGQSNGSFIIKAGGTIPTIDINMSLLVFVPNAKVGFVNLENVPSAAKLYVPRNISLSGAATGTATSFDGSKDIEIPVTSIDGSLVKGIVPAAVADSDGKSIKDTYAKLTGTTFSGDVIANLGAASTYNGFTTTAMTAGAYSNAGAHNALYRGKDLTSYFDSGAMSTAIANGTFTDIYPGDYITKSITVNGTTYSNVKWIIGDLDYHLNRGDTITSAHHILVFPESSIGSAAMNATNITTGGYTGSVMWKTTIPLYATGIINAFGSAHVLTHRELLSKTEVDTIPSMGGCGNNGASTDWAWVDVKVNLFNEPMIYGGKICSSSLFDVGECNTQVAAMRHDKSLSFTRYSWNWLRAVAHSTGFAFVRAGGNADYGGSSYVVGVRPYFLLY